MATPTSATPTSRALSASERLYLEILGPADTASGTFFTALKALPSTATGADVQRIATPAADAIDAADRRLLEASWPAPVFADVKEMVSADARLVSDLRTVSAQLRITSGTWKSRFESDVASVAKTVSITRSDLSKTSK